MGDINHDGKDDIIVGAGTGAQPHVKVFNGSDGIELSLPPLPAFASTFKGGVRVSVGDVNGDGILELIVGAGRLRRK